MTNLFRWGRLRLLSAAVFAALALGHDARAEDAPFHFGVGAHFAFTPQRGYQPNTQRPLMRELGIDAFRDDVDDDAFVTPRPRLPLGPRLSRLSEIVADRIATPVLILRGRNLGSAAEPRFAPRDAAERRIFSTFAADVVAATQPFSPIYEIWNEWNMQWRERAPYGGLFGHVKEDPDYSPENYVAVAKDAYAAIKGANPRAVVLTGSIGEDADWTWTRRALRAGLAESGDGLSVHFYNHCNPQPGRTAENMIERALDFRSMVENETGKPTLPVYITEFGWPNDNGPCGIPFDLAASNIAQFTLWSTAQDWIRGVWIYELRNSGLRPDEREDNFGLYDYANEPKPAACAYREAIALARGLEGKRFRNAPDGYRWMEGYAADGTSVWAIWTTASYARGRVALADAEPYGARVLCAAPSSNGAGEALEIGSMPLVIRFAGDAGATSTRFGRLGR